MRQEHTIAAAHWATPRHPGKRRWWQSPTILQHINRLVCGESVAGAWAGLIAKMREEKPSGWDTAISIGCGEGAKEIKLVVAGLVRHFDLFEISEARVERGRALAEKSGVSEQVTFHVRDAFDGEPKQYDLVYWNNALHHMLDTRAAVLWSRDHLKPGGSFVMDDYIGPNRQQWTEAELNAAQGVRMMLPAKYRRDPGAMENELPSRPPRFSVDEMIRRDPTEAPDSESIIPSVKEIFPDAEIVMTGGVIYHLALNDVIAHFTEEDDRELLSGLLVADEALAADGLSHYAIAIAHK